MIENSKAPKPQLISRLYFLGPHMHNQLKLFLLLPYSRPRMDEWINKMGVDRIQIVKWHGPQDRARSREIEKDGEENKNVYRKNTKRRRKKIDEVSICNRKRPKRSMNIIVLLFAWFSQRSGVMHSACVSFYVMSYLIIIHNVALAIGESKTKSLNDVQSTGWTATSE